MRYRHVDKRPLGLVVLFVAQFAVSVAIVVLASLRQMGDPPPVWTGLVDVGLVFTLLITTRYLNGFDKEHTGKRTFRVAYVVAAGITCGLLVALWLVRNIIDLNVLLPGLAWRIGVLLWSLPAVINVLESLAWSTPPVAASTEG